MLNVNNLAPKPPVGRSEYGRVKVALPKGKGLMDWVRLSTSKILAKRRQPSVDHEELMKHNTVYDVTSYLDFHPGGIPELMRAAGRDATPLFNQYHAWVNYESMLKSCHVGRFSGDLNKLPPPGPSTIDESVNTAKTVSDGFIVPQTSQSVAINIKMESNMLVISSAEWSSLTIENIVFDLNSKTRSLRILVRHFNNPTVEISYGSIRKELSLYKAKLQVNKDTVQLKFDGLDSDLSDFLENSERTIRKRPTVRYMECIIKDVRKISHDTLLFNVEVPEGVHLPIPLGNHVSIRVKRGLVATYRPYTPVDYRLPSEEIRAGSLTFLIKIYPDGSFTQALKNLKQGDKMEISDPIGDKDICEFIGNDDVIMLAAGTGITPMIPIIKARLGQLGKKTELFLFNKTEKDIVEDDWAPIRWNNPTIKVHHILSSPSLEWTGLSGRIGPTHLPTLEDGTKVLVCGPDGFIESAVNVLDSKGIPSSRIHIFKG